MPTRYGDDFEVGYRHETPSVTVTETHMVLFTGITGDFYPLHVDAVHAAQTQFGERLVHGPLVFSLAIGLVSLSGMFQDSAVAWLGADSVRMLAPVRIGDTLRVVAEAKSLAHTSNPLKGIQTWMFEVANQRKETVLAFDHRVMVHLRPRTG
jgi:acyl dehydratase